MLAFTSFNFCYYIFPFFVYKIVTEIVIVVVVRLNNNNINHLLV